MGPVVHASATVALLAGANLAGYNVNYEIVGATVLGGFFLDGDKVLEIIANRQKSKRGELPDITARCRIGHSILAWPFGWLLSVVVGSWLPLLAVLLHAVADSAIPGLVKNGKQYPSHPPLKWIMFPFSKKLWYEIVPKGWPVTYPPEFNQIYSKWAPAISAVLILLSVSAWLATK